MGRSGIGAVIISCLLFASACGDPAEREAKYLERGKAHFENGNFEKAGVEFRNVLQINPKSAEAYYYLGQIAEAELSFGTAWKWYRQAIQEQPTFLPALSELGQLYLLANELDRAQDQLDAIYRIAPGHPFGLFLEAGILLRRGDAATAVERARAALDADPSLQGAAIILALGLQEVGDPDGALEALETAIGHHSKDESLYRVKIQILEQNERYDEAEAVHHQLISLAPQNLAIRSNLAWFYIRRGDLDAAQETIRKSVMDFPDDLAVHHLLIDFLLNQRSPELAEASLEELTSEYPEIVDYKFAIATALLRGGAGDKGMAVYQEIISQTESPATKARAMTGLADHYLSVGNLEQAKRLVEKVLETDVGNIDALLIRARIRYEGGQLSLALRDLRALLGNDPSSEQGLFLIAKVYRDNGETDLAIDAFRKLLQVQPANIDARAQLASLLARRGDVSKAMPVLDEALLIAPDSIVVLQSQAEILMSQQDWGNAALIAERLAQSNGGELIGYLYLGQIHAMQGKNADAATAYQHALEVSPENEAALNGYVRSLMDDGRYDEARTFLESRALAYPDDAQTFNLLALAYHATGADVRQVSETFLKAAALDKNWPDPLLNLGRTFIEARMPERAVGVLREGLSREQDHAAISVALAGAYEQLGEYRAAMDIYERMIARGQGSLFVNNNLALLIADLDFRDADRMERAYDLTKNFERVGSPVLLDTLGWVHYRLGNFDEAERLLTKAIKKGLDTPQVHYHLGLTYLSMNDPRRARTSLEKSVVQGANYLGLEEAKETLARM